MWYYQGWPRYVSAAERRQRALSAAKELRRQGRVLSPVVIRGRGIAATFWGKAWCDNLESYRDYANRLPRGRTYARNGSVLDLEIGEAEVVALVSGSSLYDVKISIARIAKQPWAGICKDCAGGIDSLVELLQGRLSASVMERICRQGAGLFPKPAEIRFSCTCPDYASMCKHVAAALYGVGARLDREPELLFRLRAVDARELLASAGTATTASGPAPAPGRALDGADLAQLFGLEIDSGAAPVTKKTAGIAKSKPARAGKRAAAKPPRAVPDAPRRKPARSATAGKGARKPIRAKGGTAMKRSGRRPPPTKAGRKGRPRDRETSA